MLAASVALFLHQETDEPFRQFPQVGNLKMHLAVSGYAVIFTREYHKAHRHLRVAVLHGDKHLLPLFQ